jgi:hypothetical protein
LLVLQIPMQVPEPAPERGQGLKAATYRLDQQSHSVGHLYRLSHR